jgi:cytoskeletal protein CcmA (bactofilin family)
MAIFSSSTTNPNAPAPPPNQGVPVRQNTGALSPVAPIQNDEKVETLVGASTSIRGNLRAEGTIRVDGTVEGEIQTAGNVVIGRGGKVMASVTAANVMVAGQVKGNISATHRLEIVASGKVWGDITVASLLIEEGGVFRGQSIMKDDNASEPMFDLPGTSLATTTTSSHSSAPAAAPTASASANGK